MNADEAERPPSPGRRRTRWRLRNVRAILRAGGVHVCGGFHERKFILETDLHFAWPQFWESLQDQLHAGEQDHQLEYEHRREE